MRVLLANFSVAAELSEAITKLRAEGHEFVIGGAMPTAPTGFTIPEKLDYDLIIVRYLDPGVFAKYMETLRSKSYLGPVVRFSASLSWREARSAMHAGAADYKHTSSNSLLEVVRGLSGKK